MNMTTEVAVPLPTPTEQSRRKTALEIRSDESARQKNTLGRYRGTKDEYEAIRWLDGVSGTYEALDSQKNKKFVKAYDLLTPKQRDALYTRELEAVNDLAPIGVTLPAEDTGKDAPLIVQEFVEGKDLRDVIAEHAPFDEEATRAILKGIARKLGEAHKTGWVNRDVKPANIRYRNTDRNYAEPLINDWGLGYNTEKHLDHNHGAGTLTWKSPEQFGVNPKADERADIYAIGVILYEMMTGFDPYITMTTEQTRQAKLLAHNPREWNEKLDERLTRITIRATQPDRRRRYQTLDEMMNDLKRAE